MKNTDIVSVGPFPRTFPRDPVEFGLHGEHVAIGQILEPLVTTDRCGNILPCLANTWGFEDGGRTVIFRLEQGLKFSDGSSLSCDDVIESINRHRLNPRSQTFSLLANIETIAGSGDLIKITLKRPQYSILKILSREKLGVLPRGWKFDLNSDEPYIGTGPYRLVSRNAKFYFQKNHTHRHASTVSVECWQLIHSPPTGHQLEILPDYIPMATGEMISESKFAGLFRGDSHSIFEIQSYIQNSAWWNPKGVNYCDESQKRIKMGIIRRVFEAQIETHEFVAATGLFPAGIAGSLAKRNLFPPIDAKEIDAISSRSPSIRDITVSIPDFLRNSTFESKIIESIERELSVRFTIKESSAKTQYRPEDPFLADIMISRWAGGFNDPEGFLPALTNMLNTSLEEYLESNFSIYQDASSELNLQLRDLKFREFNAKLVNFEHFVPGWKTPVFEILHHELIKENVRSRNNPLLAEVRRA